MAKSRKHEVLGAKDELPFDAVDFGLMLATAIVPPHWPWAVVLAVTTIARRSPRVAAYLCRELGIEPSEAPAWLLPGATALTTAAQEAPQGQGATLDTLAGAKEAASATDRLAASLARLPKRVELLKLALHTSPTAIPLGVGLDQQPVWADIATDALHIGLYGQSGAGKDNLLRCWFVMLARRNRPDAVQFAFIDGKGDWLVPQLATLTHMFLAPAGGYGKAGDAAILVAVKAIDAEAQRRQQAFQEAGVISRDAYVKKTGATMPLLVVVATDVMTSVAGEVEGLLIALVSKARSLGIRVVMSMSSPAKQDTRWRGNLSTVLAGAMQAGSQDEPALGIPVKDLRYRPSQLPPPSQRPGVFVGRIGGTQALLQAPYVSEAAFDAQVGKLPTVKPFQTTSAGDRDLLASFLGETEFQERSEVKLQKLPIRGGNKSEVPASQCGVPEDESATEPPKKCSNDEEAGVPASQCGVPGVLATSSARELPITRQEIAIIARELGTGTRRSEIVKMLPGYHARLYKLYRAKVEFVAALLTPDTNDDLDAPGGPSLPDAFNF